MEILTARKNLSAFILVKAEETRKNVGFRWVGIPDAPATYEDLVAQYRHCRHTGNPLPVSNQHCHDTIYWSGARVNMNLRYWHDVMHVNLELDFSLEGELELGHFHLEQLRAAGYSRDSLEYRILDADMNGQTILVNLTGKFPKNQFIFVTDVLDNGLSNAIYNEIHA